MGIRDFFKKESPLDKDVKKVFDKLHVELTARQMVDQALSFRNLSQFDKAISLLKEVLIKYPSYTPAKTILGTTLAISGDIDGAELQFKKVLDEHSKGADFPLIEVYANLGSLYHNHRHDIQTALKYYQLALNALKPAMLDDNAYDFMVSNVHRDLCVIYFKQQDFTRAKQFAISRLQKVKDCAISLKIYNVCSQIERGEITF